MSFDKLDLVATKANLLESLSSKAVYVMEKSVDVVRTNLQEMRLHPSEAIPPMSRSSVEAMLSTRTRHVDPYADEVDDHRDQATPTPESISAWKYSVIDMESKMPHRFAIDSIYAESEDVGDCDDRDFIESAIDKAISIGQDVEFELGDGSNIVLDPHSLTALKNSGGLCDPDSTFSSLEALSSVLAFEIDHGEA
jgi:hypothetical protein